ncbi:DoxX family protein [Rubellicoccus peritrichatus]|uniref:DoxX family protein n=1 Tax=Rubellicoccus peritrichatus TaxID=3080537 RepID=A0AAQ3QSF7_9BACT|nr:DoxX family protein [Puniceicoccus sp. CR14]WOO42383.1 DoxX family protein [Puniceicoccus sp. CR14]
MLSTVSKFLDKPDFGFLIIRVIVGVIFVAAGIGKFLGGSETLEGVGQAMSIVGISFAPLFWGFLAALVETVGGLLLIVGFLFRGSAFFLLGTMIVATAVKVSTGDDFVKDIGYPLAMAAVTAGLLFTGPGKIAIQKSGGAV